jgi:hypothetical protein
MIAGVLLARAPAVLAQCYGICGYPEAPPEDEQPTAGALVVEIRPDKSQWTRYETIEGTVIWRNVSDRRVTIEPKWTTSGECVKFLGEDGFEAAKIYPKMYICGFGAPKHQNMTIEPGGSRETRFSVRTDPLSLLHGRAVSPGVWFIEPALQTATVRRAAIQVVDTQGRPPRIVSFGVTRAGIGLIREDGSLELYDLEDGQRLSKATIADYKLPSFPDMPPKFSADGTTVTIRALNAASQARVIDIATGEAREPAPRINAHVIQDAPEGNAIFLASRNQLRKVERETGEVIATWSVPGFPYVNSRGTAALTIERTGSARGSRPSAESCHSTRLQNCGRWSWVNWTVG